MMTWEEAKVLMSLGFDALTEEQIEALSEFYDACEE